MWRTDGWTDGFAIAYNTLSMLSRANNVWHDWLIQCYVACSCGRKNQVSRDVFTAGDESWEAVNKATWSYIAEGEQQMLESYLPKRTASWLIKLRPDSDVDLWMSSCCSQLPNTRSVCVCVCVCVWHLWYLITWLRSWAPIFRNNLGWDFPLFFFP